MKSLFQGFQTPRQCLREFGKGVNSALESCPHTSSNLVYISYACRVG